ncbi:MAG: sugar phosphate isomerase/epimerase family protein [Eubacteriales bacterium]
MKLSVTSYSFSQLFANGSSNQLDCVSRAKDMGFEAIEFTDLSPHDGSTEEEYAVKIGAEAKRVGITVANYTIGADFLFGSNGDTKAEIERVKRKIDVAALMGATGLRHDATYGFPAGQREYRGFDSVLPALADACRAVTEYAAGKGIRTMIENHGFFCQDSDRVEKLVNTVAHPNFGWLVDMGNFTCADENPVTAVGRAAPYAFYVHAKDFHIKSGMGPNPGEGFFMSRAGNYLRGSIIGHGDVPVRQCLSALKRAGYDGFVSVEFEGMEDALRGIAIGAANLRRFMDEI